MSERITIYLTTEQIQRIAAFSLDALVGCQINSDADDRSAADIDMVLIDRPQDTSHFRVYPNGTFRETT